MPPLPPLPLERSSPPPRLRAHTHIHIGELLSAVNRHLWQQPHPPPPVHFAALHGQQQQQQLRGGGEQSTRPRLGSAEPDMSATGTSGTMRPPSARPPSARPLPPPATQASRGGDDAAPDSSDSRPPPPRRSAYEEVKGAVPPSGPADPFAEDAEGGEGKQKWTGVSRRKQVSDKKVEDEKAKSRNRYDDLANNAESILEIPELEEEGREDLSRVVRGVWGPGKTCCVGRGWQMGHVVGLGV